LVDHFNDEGSIIDLDADFLADGFNTLENLIETDDFLLSISLLNEHFRIRSGEFGHDGELL
jgi:hypothetical protein